MTSAYPHGLACTQKMGMTGPLRRQPMPTSSARIAFGHEETVVKGSFTALGFRVSAHLIQLIDP